MRLNWGETYHGPGAADPKITRGERERELRQLAQTKQGWEVIEYYFAVYTGSLRGILLSAGQMMIETILDHEYPR